MTIDLYTWGTPNGRKVSIGLEEMGLSYRVIPVNIGKDEQFAPDFLKISPNNKIPAIVDPDGPGGEPLALFETGAILVYLAEKCGSPLWPSDPRARAITHQWLMFQMGGVGPMFGQANHFLHFNPGKSEYAEERYRTEAHRLYGVMDKRLGDAPYLAGRDYTVADIATYPWVARWEWHQIDLKRLPNVWRWFTELGEREAVKKGMAVPS
ncbi:glutathione S-transferase family protein [Rhodospirillaceae bacterium KN72]|uniref:Glutathione S-transferase family protein n=1 Tax=Pacificispira spongiicola TaxID=2729598 RepID=A0A7Y0DZ21_9PROT|nr:glutathione S-transferase N-terminal domain-containing protein [Pacificispira spongiicola]NMM44239.1 glutathione S-transferase family protein [Pacificispira spongiicola]